MFWGVHVEAWSAIAALATLGVLSATAVIALFQVRQARSLQEEEARPVVVVDFDIDRHPHIIYLSYENFGRTIAHNVKVTFDPPLKTTFTEQESNLSFFSNTFPTLAPGKTIEGVLDSAIHRLPRTDLPMQHKTTATYTDRNGKSYTTPGELDLSVYRGRMSVTKKDLGDVVDNLKAIVTSMQHFGSEFGGIRVITTTEEDAATEAAEQAEESRRLHDKLHDQLYPKHDTPDETA
jgi:hypothetical protein